jgi:hypothetical protein
MSGASEGFDLSRPDHLPQRRADGGDRDPSWLPRQRRGTTPQMIGRYPDYDVFDSMSTWDEATRATVEARMNVPRTMSFFALEEQPVARRLCDLVMAQDHEPRIPVVELVDEKLHAGKLDGYHFDDMPKDPETWRRALAGLNEVALARHGENFADLSNEEALAIVRAFSQGQLSGGAWESVNVKRAWSVCTRAILAAFYSHPWSWNEIGFGGPAYPRGYMRMGPLSTLDPSEEPGATSEDPVSASEHGQV